MQSRTLVQGLSPVNELMIYTCFQNFYGISAVQPSLGKVSHMHKVENIQMLFVKQENIQEDMLHQCHTYIPNFAVMRLVEK